MPPTVDEVIARRRMTRSFHETPIATDVLDRVLDAAAGAPSAGNSSALDLLVLSTPDETARYWQTTLIGPARGRFGFPGLLRAPVLVVLWIEPDAYLRRYDEPDKAAAGLGRSLEAWPIPYWWVDGGMAAAQLQLAAIAHGLGVCFFGLFDHEEAVRLEFGVPTERRAVGTIALGHGDGGDRAGRSAGRGRRPTSEIVHRGAW